MIKRLTRRLLLAQALIIAVIFLALTERWHLATLPALMLGLGIIMLGRLAITASGFALSRLYSSPVPAGLKLSLRQSGKMFIGEYLASVWSWYWALPFARVRPWRPEHVRGLPILLIHGYGCNSGYWRILAAQLKRHGIAHRAVDLEPVFGCIEDYMDIVGKAVDALCRDAGKNQVLVVAHSMGGLVIRAYMREHNDPRIAKILTLGTPHRGTVLARFSRGTNCRQMGWSAGMDGGIPSEWLQKLDASEDPARRSLFVSVFSHHDNIIAPQTSSYLAGARNIEMAGIGHVALGMHPDVCRQVIAQSLSS